MQRELHLRQEAVLLSSINLMSEKSSGSQKILTIVSKRFTILMLRIFLHSSLGSISRLWMQ